MLLENRRVSPKSFAFSSKKQRVFQCFLPDIIRHLGRPQRSDSQKRMEFGNFGFNKRNWRSLPLLGDAEQPLPSLFDSCPIALGGERDNVSRNRAMKMGNKKRPIPDKVIDLCASGWA